MSASSSASPSAPSSAAPQHRFLLRCLRSSDYDDLAELARHTYNGYDYLCSKMGHWLAHPALFVCIAVEYAGQAGEEPDLDNRSILTLKSDRAPQPPQTFVHTRADGQLWTHEELRRDTPAAADGASSPSASAPSPSLPLHDSVAVSLSSPSPPPASFSSLSRFRGHVVALEVCALFDGGATGFLHALRVHPELRGFGLASVLHSRCLHLAESVYHVRAVRETTSESNSVSIHLGSKHGLRVTHRFDCEHFSVQYARDELMPKLHAQMQMLSAALPTLDLLPAGSTADRPTRGHSDQVLSLIAAHPSDEQLRLLRVYWMAYEPTEANLVYLCSEAALPAGSQSSASSVDPAHPDQLLCATMHPYFLTVSTTADEGQDKADATAESTSSASSSSSSSSSPVSCGPSACPPIGAFSLALTTHDQSGWFRTFSLFAPSPPQDRPAYESLSYRLLLQQFFYQLLAATSNRHETAEYRCKAAESADQPSRPYSTQTFAHAITRVQTSTPTWFAVAFAELQTKIAAVESGSVAAPVSASSSPSSAPAYSWGGRRHERMIILEKRMQGSAEESC